MGWFSNKKRVAQVHAGRKYSNSEYNFNLTIPVDWKVLSENFYDEIPWMSPVRISGSDGPHLTPCVQILTAVVERDDAGLSKYMSKAEGDLRGNFPDFAIISKSEQALLNWPSAWIAYSYRRDNRTIQELNVTTFFGKPRAVWFQFICEAEKEHAARDFPVFEEIIHSLNFGMSCIRLPYVVLAGTTSCSLCQKPISSTSSANSMVSLKFGKFMGVCDECRNILSKTA